MLKVVELEDTKADEHYSSAFSFEKLDQICETAPDLLLTEMLNNRFFQLTGINLPINTKIIYAPSPSTNSFSSSIEKNNFSGTLLPTPAPFYTQYIAQSQTPFAQLHSYFQQTLAQEGWRYKNRSSELLSIFDAKKINLSLTLLVRPHDNNANITLLHFLVKEKKKA